MKILLLAISTFSITIASLFSQVNASDRDTALQHFLGISRIGSSFPISQPATSGFATVLVFKHGKFSKRIGDTPIIFNFGQTPIALGNSKAGVAPSTVQVEFLWGPRDGKIGYLFQATVGSTGVIPKFHEMAELGAINTTLSDVAKDPGQPEFRDMILLGAAYAITKLAKSNSVEDQIKASDIALIVVFKQFQSENERQKFIEALNEKYKS